MSDDQPRVCAGCGEKIVITGPEPLVFQTLSDLEGHELTSWHSGCWLHSLATR